MGKWVCKFQGDRCEDVARLVLGSIIKTDNAWLFYDQAIKPENVVINDEHNGLETAKLTKYAVENRMTSILKSNQKSVTKQGDEKS